MTASYEPQANESFSVQQFFKNAAEVWASSPHLRSKSKLHHEIKQTSKKQSEESQLPWKAKGCNEIQGFRGNCDSLGKLGMCPSLAEPDSNGFPRSNFRMFHVKHHIKIRQSWLQTTSHRQWKVFRCSSFLKMLPRCGRAAHICGANQNCTMR